MGSLPQRALPLATASPGRSRGAVYATAQVREQAGQQRAPHMIANFLKDLAAAFHTFYNAHKVLVDDVTVQEARVALCLATQQVLQNGLDILGVSAPESM